MELPSLQLQLDYNLPGAVIPFELNNTLYKRSGT